MKLLKVMLSVGNVHDFEAALALLPGIELVGKKILADKAYSCEQISSFSAEHGAVACIPDKANFKITFNLPTAPRISSEFPPPHRFMINLIRNYG